MTGKEETGHAFGIFDAMFQFEDSKSMREMREETRERERRKQKGDSKGIERKGERDVLLMSSSTFSSG